MGDTTPVKPYRLTFENKPGYLYAYVEGDHDSYEVSRSFWQEIAYESVRVRAQRILIDENIVQAAPMADVFLLCSELPHMGFGAARVAFVDRHLDHNEVNEFGELVAINRGFNGKLFNDEQAAIDWLVTDQ